MALTAIDIIAYSIAGGIVLIVGWWVLFRWVPEGGLVAPYVYHGYLAGVTRRETIPAVVVGSVAFLPVIRNGVDSVGFVWAILSGVFLGGLLIGAVAVANRPRAKLLENAQGDGDTVPNQGPCVVEGTAGETADGSTLTTPVTQRDAVCYIASVAQFKEQPFQLFYTYGAYFTTGFSIEQTPFAVTGSFGSVAVDPDGAWISLAEGSPTDIQVNLKGALTGGPAEHEIVVEEGEEIPDHLSGEQSPFANPLPTNDDGTAARELRFKESVIEPGENIVVAGEAQPGQEYGTTRLRCQKAGAFIARGTYDQVSDSLAATTRRNLVISEILTVVGVSGLILMSL